MAAEAQPAGDPFDALGDPHRRRIVDLISAEPRSVADLAAAMPISRPAVSRHLRLLKDAGLVGEEPAGTRRIYFLRTEGVDAMRGYLEQIWGETAARFKLAAENTASPRRPSPRRPS
jgi:DNA-binding transcriptional ArsR family regulator